MFILKVTIGIKKDVPLSSPTSALSTLLQTVLIFYNSLLIIC